MRIEAVDPDGDAFAAWSAVVDAAARHERPGNPDWTAQDLRALARRGRATDGRVPASLVDLLLVRDGGRPVGAARLERPTRDNRSLAAAELAVLPQARRRGAGTALVAELARRAAADGRSVLVVELDEVDATRSSPGRAFATALGFTCALEEVRRDLVLPVDPQRLAVLERDAAVHPGGYGVVTWLRRCPDALAADRAALARTMSADVPTGELPVEEEDWDVPRLRDHEDLVAEQGRLLVAAGAVHRGTGRLVGYTELHALRAGDRAHQWDTLVVGAHRGHRLGLLVKVAALRALGQALPAVRRVSTWNAVDNAPMVAVNDALGFVPAGLSSEWQRPV